MDNTILESEYTKMDNIDFKKVDSINFLKTSVYTAVRLSGLTAAVTVKIRQQAHLVAKAYALTSRRRAVVNPSLRFYQLHR